MWPPRGSLLEAASSMQRGLLEEALSEAACAIKPVLRNQAKPGRDTTRPKRNDGHQTSN